MMEDVRVKLNPGLPWQKLRSTRRRLSLPANWKDKGRDGSDKKARKKK
jgi:hypothetical protein